MPANTCTLNFIYLTEMEMDRIVTKISQTGVISMTINIDTFSEDDLHRTIDSESDWEHRKIITMAVLCSSMCADIVRWV